MNVNVIAKTAEDSSQKVYHENCLKKGKMNEKTEPRYILSEHAFGQIVGALKNTEPILGYMSDEERLNYAVTFLSLCKEVTHVLDDDNKCSNCKNLIDVMTDCGKFGAHETIEPNYCPICGVRFDRFS